MIYLGIFTAGNSVFYAGNFHNEAGTLEDPASPEAQLRNPSGSWSALAAPSKQNGKTGHFGGVIDTTGFAAGQYAIRMAGTVATGKEVATGFAFTVDAAVKSVANEVGITQEGADKVWSSVTRKLTAPDNITSNNSKITLDGSGNVTLKSGTHTGAVIPTVTTTATATSVTSLAGNVETGVTYNGALQEIARNVLSLTRGNVMIHSTSTVTVSYAPALPSGAAIELWAACSANFIGSTDGINTATKVLVGTVDSTGWTQGASWPVAELDRDAFYLRIVPPENGALPSGVLAITFGGAGFAHSIKVRIPEYLHSPSTTNENYLFFDSDGRLYDNLNQTSGGGGYRRVAVSDSDLSISGNLDAPVSSRSTFDPESDLFDSNGSEGWTWKEGFRLVFAFLLGERSGGGRAGNKSFKVPGGAKTRVVMATDANGNSSASHNLDTSDA